MEDLKKYKPILITALCAVVMLWSYHTFVYSNPVFEFSETSESLTRETFFSEQDKSIERNVRRSYAELMSIAQSHMHEEKIIEARSYYFQAKTLYPERMEPRKHLCYIDMLLCQQYEQYCSYTKREIYYAMQHASDNDPVSKDYIRSLASLIQMDSLLHLDEEEALSEIF